MPQSNNENSLRKKGGPGKLHEWTLPLGRGVEEEKEFRNWYGNWSAISGIHSDPDHEGHKYDYREAHKAGVVPTLNPQDNLYHWDSRFKHPDHPARYVEGMDTITGKPVDINSSEYKEWQSSQALTTEFDSLNQHYFAEDPRTGKYYKVGKDANTGERIWEETSDITPQTVGEARIIGEVSPGEAELQDPSLDPSTALERMRSGLINNPGEKLRDLQRVFGPENVKMTNEGLAFRRHVSEEFRLMDEKDLTTRDLYDFLGQVLPTAGGISGEIVGGIPGAFAGGTVGHAATEGIKGALGVGDVGAGDKDLTTTVLEAGGRGVSEGAAAVIGRGASEIAAWPFNRLSSKITPEARSILAMTEGDPGIVITPGMLSSSPFVQMFDSFVENSLTGAGFQAIKQGTVEHAKGNVRRFGFQIADHISEVTPGQTIKSMMNIVRGGRFGYENLLSVAGQWRDRFFKKAHEQWKPRVPLNIPRKEVDQIKRLIGEGNFNTVLRDNPSIGSNPITVNGDGSMTVQSAIRLRTWIDANKRAIQEGVKQAGDPTTVTDKARNFKIAENRLSNYIVNAMPETIRVGGKDLNIRALWNLHNEQFKAGFLQKNVIYKLIDNIVDNPNAPFILNELDDTMIKELRHHLGSTHPSYRVLGETVMQHGIDKAFEGAGTAASQTKNLRQMLFGTGETIGTGARDKMKMFLGEEGMADVEKALQILEFVTKEPAVEFGKIGATMVQFGAALGILTGKLTGTNIGILLLPGGLGKMWGSPSLRKLFINGLSAARKGNIERAMSVAARITGMNQMLDEAYTKILTVPAPNEDPGGPQLGMFMDKFQPPTDEIENAPQKLR